MSEWISVEDKTPDDESVIGNVFVKTASGWVGVSSYADNYDLFAVPDVTHWMPLPEPPKELTND